MLLFVFGTLKAGFPLHESALGNAEFVGPSFTVEPYPLVIAGDWYAPMLFDEPGTGFRVAGDVYDVSMEGLVLVDALESVGLPGHLRISIQIELKSGSPRLEAAAYPKHRCLAHPLHTGYLSHYQDRRFIPFQQRRVAAPGRCMCPAPLTT